MPIQLGNVPTDDRQLGRVSVFYTTPAWDGTTDLTDSLEYLGDTEGAATFNPNESQVDLTTPELRGAAPLKSYVEGYGPTFEAPFFAASPAIQAILSATGQDSGGHTRRIPVVLQTLVAFAEELFFVPATNEYDAILDFDGTTWTKDSGSGPTALTPDEDRLLGLTLWLWSGTWMRPEVVFQHEDASKSVNSATFKSIVNEGLPNGHQLWTRGDPSQFGINITGAT